MFKPGDLVRLKSGSPKMVVTRVLETGASVGFASDKTTGIKSLEVGYFAKEASGGMFDFAKAVVETYRTLTLPADCFLSDEPPVVAELPTEEERES